jgi:hypothetical protein
VISNTTRPAPGTAPYAASKGTIEHLTKVAPTDHHRAANELAITDWDPGSKQPIFKTAAARVNLVGAGGGNAAPVPTNTASRPVIADVPATRGGPAANADEQLTITGGV